MASCSVKKASETNYEVTTLIFISNNGDIEISYPKLNIEDSDKYSKTNEVIENIATGVLYRYAHEDLDILSLKIEYKIMYQSPEFISIIFFGEGYIKGTAHPNQWFYSASIDLQDNVQCHLSDIIEIDNRIIQMLADGRFSLVYPDEMQGFEYETGLQNVISVTSDNAKEYLLNSDSIESQYCSVYSYITNDSLGLSFETISALGGHAEYEIPLGEISEILKFELH